MHHEYPTSTFEKRLNRRRARHMGHLEARRAVMTEVLLCAFCRARTDDLDEDDHCAICRHDHDTDYYDDERDWDIYHALLVEDEREREAEERYEHMETDREYYEREIEHWDDYY